MRRGLDRKREAMMLRPRTIAHLFGTLKHWMGSTHFLTLEPEHVGAPMKLHVLAYQPEACAESPGHQAVPRRARAIAPSKSEAP